MPDSQPADLALTALAPSPGPTSAPSQEQPLPDPLLLQDVEALGPLDDLQDGLHLGRAEALALPLLLCLVGVHRPAGVQPGESTAHKSSPGANRRPHHTHQGPSSVCVSGARQSANAASATHQLLGPTRMAARPQHLTGVGHGTYKRPQHKRFRGKTIRRRPSTWI